MLFFFHVAAEVASIDDDFDVGVDFTEEMIQATVEAETASLIRNNGTVVKFREETICKDAPVAVVSPPREQCAKLKQESVTSTLKSILKCPSHLRHKEVNEAMDLFVAQQSQETQDRVAIIEADCKKFDNQKQSADDIGVYSFVHPKYPFIRSNRNEFMVAELLEAQVFPDRIILEEELYVLDNHPFRPRLWLTPKAVSIMRNHSNI